MRIGTSQMTGNIDRTCVEKLGIPLMVLMENAALKVLKHLDTDRYSVYTIICGSGNNGGDGLALARHLVVLGKKVRVFMIQTGNSMSECCKINYNILQNMGVQVKKTDSLKEMETLSASIREADITVDALFGTGLNRKVEGIYEGVINIINENSHFTVSIDIPSGLNGDSGEVMGCCVKADRTVCFEFYKRGFLNYETGDFGGNIVVESIGVPENVLEQYHNNEYIFEKKDLLNYLKPRSKYGHKGDYGRTLIIAGSEGFTGAAYLATQSAVRTGSGLVTLACREKVQSILAAKLSEAMTIRLEDEEKLIRHLTNCDAAAIGPGMGNSEETLHLLELVLEHSRGPVIIDADGINVMAGHLELFKKRKQPVIITPHAGEMSRIAMRPVQHVNSSRPDLSKEFALQHNIIVLLKGYQTIITDGRKTYINPTGSSAMASGGMGDCLTGIIASLAGQGVPALEAAACGAYIHGYAGQCLSEEMFSVNASHIIERLPYVMKEILE